MNKLMLNFVEINTIADKTKRDRTAQYTTDS